MCISKSFCILVQLMRDNNQNPKKMKISREQVEELVEKSGEWTGVAGSGTGTNWDLLVFENEDYEELELTHHDGVYYIDGGETDYEEFVEFISNL